MVYISQSHTWADPTTSTQDVITAAKLNGNTDDFVSGLSDGTKDINVNQITGALSGNSSTGSALSTARNINITGDEEGTVAFDGSAPVSIATTGELLSQGVISLGFTDACQVVMDTLAASLSVTTYEDFVVKWGAIKKACGRNNATALSAAITAYNTAYSSDTISAGQITTLNANVGASPLTNLSDMPVLESSTNMTYESISAPVNSSQIKITLNLPISLAGSSTQNLMPFVSCFGSEGYIGDGAGGFTSIDDETKLNIVEIVEYNATHLRLNITFPGRIYDSYFVSNYDEVPLKIYVLVYKV